MNDLTRQEIDKIRVRATKNVDASGHYPICRNAFIFIEMKRLIKERLAEQSTMQGERLQEANCA